MPCKLALSLPLSQLWLLTWTRETRCENLIWLQYLHSLQDTGAKRAFLAQGQAPLLGNAPCQKAAEERKATTFKIKSSLSHAMALQDEIEKSCVFGVPWSSEIFFWKLIETFVPPAEGCSLIHRHWRMYLPPRHSVGLHDTRVGAGWRCGY